jgi:hypothetical protein
MSADISWMICCEEFIVKDNGLCDAKDLLFELHTEQVPVTGSVEIDVAALWRSSDYTIEPLVQARLAIIASDGTVHPSNETWQIAFTSPQVLWYKRITDLYLPSFGFTSIAVQALENGDWHTKREFTILVLEGT